MEYTITNVVADTVRGVVDFKLFLERDGNKIPERRYRAKRGHIYKFILLRDGIVYFVGFAEELWDTTPLEDTKGNKYSCTDILYLVDGKYEPA